MQCQICQEEVNKLYRHHVTPKVKGGKNGEIAKCCRTCAHQVHMLFNEKELAAMSFEELVATEQMQKYIKWKKKHPGEFSHRMSKKVKKWKQFHR
jgi:protein-arginine kinase activator protein McsA